MSVPPEDRDAWMDAFDPAILADVSTLPNRATELRELGRIGWPMRRLDGEPGFTRIPWETAIAEQRTLTARASEIEAELRRVQLIEEVSLPHDTVAPGTAVKYRDVRTGDVHRVVLLGPWDTGGDEIVSYRAPLAAGLLGLKTGERTQLALPSGELEVEVVSIEPYAL